MERCLTLQARWILPLTGPPVANGFVTVNEHQIVQVSSSPPRGQAIHKLGNRILLPRFVNVHTHLEFSSLKSPFAVAGGFPGWVREVIKWRQQRDATPTTVEPSAQAAAIAAGVEECISRGTGLLGEIATSPWPTSGYSRELNSVLFLEQLGVLPSQADERLKAVTLRLKELLNLTAQLPHRIGLSPHAPYSLSKSLFIGMVDLACDEQVPLAMHLAETREEIDWLNGAANGFSALQERLGVPNDQQWRPCQNWLLEQLARAKNAIVIHGNYLSSSHWSQLARERERLSVVFCPRTHRYFGHAPYPLIEMLKAGVRVAIGTDSRASNPSLDLLEELKLIRCSFPDLDPTEILRLGTVNGAEALGQADRMGQLAEGMCPLMLSIACPSEREVDPAAWVLDSDAQLELLGPWLQN